MMTAKQWSVAASMIDSLVQKELNQAVSSKKDVIGSGKKALATAAAATKQQQSPRAAATSAKKQPPPAAAAKLMSELDYRLHSRFRAIERCLDEGVPSAEACEASVHVLLSLAPLLGPNEGTLVQIASAARRASRAVAPPSLSSPAREDKPHNTCRGPPPSSAMAPVADEHGAPFYFSVVNQQQALVDALTAERNGACELLDSQRRDMAAKESALMAAKADLQDSAEKIDDLMKLELVRREQLKQVRAERATQKAELAELLHVQSHATRMQLEEQRKLKEVRQTLLEEHTERENTLAAKSQYSSMLHRSEGSTTISSPAKSPTSRSPRRSIRPGVEATMASHGLRSPR